MKFSKACLSYGLCGQFSLSASWQREGYQLSLLQGEFTTVKLRRLTRVLCHEDCRVRRRRFRQGLVEYCADGLGRASVVSLFCAPFCFFCVVFAVEVLFLLASNKKTIVKLKIKTKKTNSASENAFISVLFTYHETSFMVNDLNHNMAHGTEELFMTLMIQQVAIDCKFYVLFFFLLLFFRLTAVLRCREV